MATAPCLPMATSASWRIFPPHCSIHARAEPAWAWAVGQTVTMTACGEVLQNVRASVAASRSAILSPALRSGRAERRGSPGREMHRVGGRARELKPAAHRSSESKGAMRQWYGIERRKEQAKLQLGGRIVQITHH